MGLYIYHRHLDRRRQFQLESIKSGLIISTEYKQRCKVKLCKTPGLYIGQRKHENRIISCEGNTECRFCCRKLRNIFTINGRKWCHFLITDNLHSKRFTTFYLAIWLSSWPIHQLFLFINWLHNLNTIAIIWRQFVTKLPNIIFVTKLFYNFNWCNIVFGNITMNSSIDNLN